MCVCVGGGGLIVLSFSAFLFSFPKPNKNLFPLWSREKIIFVSTEHSFCLTFYFLHLWWEPNFSSPSAEEIKIHSINSPPLGI